MQTHTLVRHGDIQKWVAARKGQPAIRHVVDPSGQTNPSLELAFGHNQTLSDTPSVDSGKSPCSWSAWLAELDRQRLALKVADGKTPVFEFVPRGRQN
jgi:hypothetical protein